MTEKQIRVRIRNLQIERAEQITSIVNHNQDKDLVQMQANIEHQNKYFDKEVYALLKQLNTAPRQE